MLDDVEKLAIAVRGAVTRLPSREEVLAGRWDGISVQEEFKRLNKLSCNAQEWVKTSIYFKGMNQLREAEIALRMATQCDPEQSEIWFQLGQVLEMQSNVNGAIAVLARAVELNPTESMYKEFLERLQNATPATEQPSNKGPKTQRWKKRMKEQSTWKSVKVFYTAKSLEEEVEKKHQEMKDDLNS